MLSDLSLNEAQTWWMDRLHPVHETLSVPLNAAIDRIAAHDLYASQSLPGADVSAMDGVALALVTELPVSGVNYRFNIIGESLAGHPFTGSCHENQAVHITTGAKVPNGGQCVVMKEYVQNLHDHIEIDGSYLIEGSNIRRAGEDIESGDHLIRKGICLNSGNIAILGAMGFDSALVFRPLRIICFSTGDELIESSIVSSPDSIHDSNRPMLISMLQRAGAEVIDLGIVPDQPFEAEAFIHQMQAADLIVSTGGVSVGSADWIKDFMRRHGSLDLWRVRMKPGRPLAIGRIGSTNWLAMPGNPVSAWVVQWLFLWPALQRLSGLSVDNIRVTPIRLPITRPVNKKTGRSLCLTARIDPDPDGILRASPMPSQGSAMLSSINGANALIVLDEASGNVNKESMVPVVPAGAVFL